MPVKGLESITLKIDHDTLMAWMALGPDWADKMIALIIAHRPRPTSDQTLPVARLMPDGTVASRRAISDADEG